MRWTIASRTACSASVFMAGDVSGIEPAKLRGCAPPSLTTASQVMLLMPMAKSASYVYTLALAPCSWVLEVMCMGRPHSQRHSPSLGVVPAPQQQPLPPHRVG